MWDESTSPFRNFNGCTVEVCEWRSNFIPHLQGIWLLIHPGISSILEKGGPDLLNHWGRVTHICVSKVTIIGSDNGLSPGRRQAIIWTNAGILLIGPFRTNFSEKLIGIQTFSFKKMPLKISSAKWRPFCLGLNVLTLYSTVNWILLK